MIKFNDVCYHYDGTTNGINGIAFNVEESDCIAVVGKNGAGKSTLLNIIAGVMLPQEGAINCHAELSYHDLGFSSQKQAIDWYLNVYDNVALGARLIGMREKDASRATAGILDIMDLASLSDRALDSLSGGQQQRVQVGRALVHNPKLMVLDEPSTGMDFHYSQKLFEYINNKCVSENKIAFISSHDLSMLQNYCNKILYIESGTQVFYGGMQDFLNGNYSRNETIISFDGEMSENTRKQLMGNNVALDEGCATITNDTTASLNIVIGALLNEVTITGIKNELTTLRDLLSERTK